MLLDLLIIQAEPLEYRIELDAGLADHQTANAGPGLHEDTHTAADARPGANVRLQFPVFLAVAVHAGLEGLLGRTRVYSLPLLMQVPRWVNPTATLCKMNPLYLLKPHWHQDQGRRLGCLQSRRPSSWY